MIEDIICYLHTNNEFEYGFLDIVDNSVERRISKKSNLIHIPCENIELNSLFLVHVEIESGRTTFTCTQSPINTYLDILQDKNICSLLKTWINSVRFEKINLFWQPVVSAYFDCAQQPPLNDLCDKLLSCQCHLKTSIALSLKSPLRPFDLCSLPISRNNGTTWYIHHPVCKPDRVFKTIGLTIGKHGETVHEFPDRAGHDAIFIGELK